MSVTPCLPNSLTHSRIHDEDRQATEKEKILTASKATTMTTTAETVAAMLTCITAVQAS